MPASVFPASSGFSPCLDSVCGCTPASESTVDGGTAIGFSPGDHVCPASNRVALGRAHRYLSHSSSHFMTSQNSSLAQASSMAWHTRHILTCLMTSCICSASSSETGSQSTMGCIAMHSPSHLISMELISLFSCITRRATFSFC